MKTPLQLNLTHADDIYQALINLHDNLSAEQSKQVNAKLILLLANHIGDEQVIFEAIAIARQTASTT